MTTTLTSSETTAGIEAGIDALVRNKQMGEVAAAFSRSSLNALCNTGLPFDSLPGHIKARIIIAHSDLCFAVDHATKNVAIN